LKIGSQAFALIKASSIIIVSDLGGAKLSARNQLSGQSFP
jgi:molybdate transport system regulatory protein